MRRRFPEGFRHCQPPELGVGIVEGGRGVNSYTRFGNVARGSTWSDSIRQMSKSHAILRRAKKVDSLSPKLFHAGLEEAQRRGSLGSKLRNKSGFAIYVLPIIYHLAGNFKETAQKLSRCKVRTNSGKRAAKDTTQRSRATMTQKTFELELELDSPEARASNQRMRRTSVWRETGLDE